MMDALINRRRALSTQVGDDDPYADWEFGKAIARSTRGQVIDYEGTALSPYLPAEGSHTFTIVYAVSRNLEVPIVYATDYGEFDDRKEWVTGSPNSFKTANLAARVNRTYVRFAVWVADIDNCYLRDDTTGEYIWKGKNVV